MKGRQNQTLEGTLERPKCLVDCMNDSHFPGLRINRERVTRSGDKLSVDWPFVEGPDIGTREPPGSEAWSQEKQGL